MKKFTFLNELEKMIDAKQLVELDFSLNDKWAHCVAFILHANDEYLTFARISNDLAFQGVTICRMSDLEAIQSETMFIRELKKGLSDNSLQESASKEIQNIKKFSFEGFVSAFVGTSTLIDITSEKEGYTGKVIGLDDKILILDEYYSEDDGRFARSYINPANITSITVGGTWLKIITRSLKDKNIL